MTTLLERFNQIKQNTVQQESLQRDDKVLIVDALHTYIRHFPATPTMNDDGDHIGGVTGFLKSVGMIVRQFRPSRVILAFDGKGGSQKRRQAFSGYKDNRKSMTKLNRTYNFQTKDEEKESMRWQLKLLVNLLESLPVTVVAAENIEADDTIAYYTNLIQERGGKCIIV